MSRTAPFATTTAPAEAGLTLVELLVVMFILALLAQTAVLATESFADQALRDATEQTLGDLELALLGPPGRADAQGRAAVSGFVADVGRLPRARIGSEPAAALRELWEARDAAPVPLGEQIPLLELASPAGDSELQLACGWRGPYLRLGLGRSAPLDGWGRPINLWTTLGVGAVEGELVAGFESFGADGLDDPPGTTSPGFDADLQVVVHRESLTPLVAARHLGTLRVQVRNLASASRSFLVRVYGPVDGAPATLAQASVTVAAAADGEAVLPDIPIGPRVVRVYESTGGVVAPEADLSGTGLDLQRSRIWNVTVEHGIMPPLVVEMP